MPDGAVAAVVVVATATATPIVDDAEPAAHILVLVRRGKPGGGISFVEGRKGTGAINVINALSQHVTLTQRHFFSTILYASVGNDCQHLFNGPRPCRIYYTLPFRRSIFKAWQPHGLMVSNKISIFDTYWPRPRCTSTVYDFWKGRASCSWRRDDRPRADRERVRHAIHVRGPVLADAEAMDADPDSDPGTDNIGMDVEDDAGSGPAVGVMTVDDEIPCVRHPTQPSSPL